MTLGENIKARRTQLKLSQEYVADQLGISRQAVAKWESGKSRPNAANLAQLAVLLETQVSVLTAQPEVPDQQTEALSGPLTERERRHSARMLVGRAAGALLINAGWDGYSSGLYSDLPWYWLAILAVGLLLMFRTSLDMQKRHRLQRLQILLGALLIFSIFFLPRLIPVSSAGLRYLLADVATAVCLIVLDLKYWRYIWKVK